MAALSDYTAGFIQTELQAVRVNNRFAMLGGILPCWEVETITTEKRSYVFLTKAAAEACITAITAEFTVSRVAWGVDANGNLVYTPENVCVAKCTPTKRSGVDAYDVTVDVYDSVKVVTPYTGV
jgi:hypothetical protein